MSLQDGHGFANCARGSLVVAAVVGACARSSTPSLRQGDPRDAGKIVWQERRAIASGPAIRGPWRMNESDYRWVDDPAVELGTSGEAAVVWVAQAHKEIFFQKFTADGTARFATPTNLSKSAETFSWLPRIRIAPNDASRIYVLWQEIVFSGGTHGGEIFFARSLDGGRTFSQPMNLSNSKAGDGKGRLDERTWDNGSLDLACGTAGELYAVWTEYEGALWLRRSTDAGETFSEAVRVVGTAEAPARAPSIAVAPSGKVHIAWAVGEDPAGKIRATALDRGGSFAAPRILGATFAHSDAPKIAVGPTGTLHLVYAESPRAGRGGYSVQYTRLKNAAPGFEIPRRIAGPPDEELKSESFPAISVDAQDRVYLLWERSRRPGEQPLGLSFTYSSDGGDHFAAASAVPNISGPDLGSNGSQQGMLTDKLAVNATGAIAVVNSTFDPGRMSRVWLVRGQVTD